MKTNIRALLVPAAACLAFPAFSATEEGRPLRSAPSREQSYDYKRPKLRSIEEVVVTAQKREERTIDIPMSIGVLSAEEIDHKGISNMKDIGYATPGMFIQEFGPGRQMIAMRGVANLVGGDPLTGVYLDEVPTTGTNSVQVGGQVDLRTTDLERVEVLKGPQGTLYGGGAVSGTVRFITADPKLDKFSGKGELIALFTEDGDPGERVSAVINAPVVTDVFGLRLAATFENNGGWIDRPSVGRSDVNENSLTNVRLKSLWRVSDAFDVEAMVIVNRNRDGDSGGVYHSAPNRSYDIPVDPSREYPFKDDYDLYNLTATYDFDSFSLLASSSYIKQDASFLYTIIPGPETKFQGIDTLDEVQTGRRRFSQEIRLTSSSDQMLKWTVGAYYQDIKDEFDRSSDNSFDEIWGGPFLFTYTDNNKFTSESMAVFADATYAITDRFEIGAGARYFEDDKSSDYVVSYAGLSSQTATFDKTTWRVTAIYGLSPSAKIYANIATGFRSGGFNALGVPPFQPETLTTYEIGSKILFQDSRGNLDFALFYSDYSDYLRRGFTFDQNGYHAVTSNFGDVRIRGAELSFNVEATEDLTLYLSGAYTDAEITSINTLDPDNNLARPGDPVDYVPEVSYSLGGEYRFFWGENVPGFVHLDYNYRDKVSVIDRSITLIPTMYSDDIRLLNARVGIARNRWSVQLFGENLTNENGSFDPWIIFSQDVRNRPRTYGLRVAVDFN